MNLAEIFFGQLPEAIYFPLFMIFAKNIREKRLIFTLTLIIEYFILKYIFIYNIWFNVTYTFMTYGILKLFYEKKAQITDIFTFGIGSILLIIVSLISYILLLMLLKIKFIYVAILSKLFLFIIIFKINYKFYNIQNLYKKLWNRNDKVKKKVKSITFRCSNLVLFNLMFYLMSKIIDLILK